MLCGAMCGKCKVSQCKDSIGGLHEVGGSWITTLGKMVCTETGLRTVRGRCDFIMFSDLIGYLILFKAVRTVRNFTSMSLDQRISKIGHKIPPCNNENNTQ